MKLTIHCVLLFVLSLCLQPQNVFAHPGIGHTVENFQEHIDSFNTSVSGAFLSVQSTQANPRSLRSIPASSDIYVETIFRV